MSRRVSKTTLRWFVFLLTMVIAVGQVTGRESEYEKKMRKLRELEEQKRKLNTKIAKKKVDTQISREKLDEIIQRYEKLLSDCQGKKSQRCADVMFNLAKFYYDEGRDDFVKAKEAYEDKMDRWERTQQGPEPINPIPDYSKSLSMYRQLIAAYPSFSRNDEAYYQIGHILLLAGEIDSSRLAYEEVVEKFPESPRASSAHFRLADFAWMDHDNTKALRHYEQVKREQVTTETWEMVHYRKAEAYYNRAEFDRAVDLFHSYVEKCDAGEYPKAQFRDMALEFMAISFSDMPDGANEAIKFFKRIGNRPYEAYVIYTVGMKNRDHGQFDDAILALGTALKHYPYYKDAPIAQHKLVECLVVKKKLEEANEEREKLVDLYQPGTEWYTKNSRERAIIDQAHSYVNKALSNICLYTHAMAMKKKDKGLYEKALKRYNKFFEKFPDDKWRVYEFKYNAAEIYNELKEYGKAVDLYWYVAMEDLKSYPAYKAQVDSLLYDDPKEYEEAVQKAEKTGAMAVSQADAGYNAIVALDNARKRKIAMDNLSEEASYGLPETQKMVDYVQTYAQRFPESKNVVDLMYLVGNMHYEAKALDKAVVVFEDIVKTYPKSPLATKAFRMLAKSYTAKGEYDLALRKYRELMAVTDPKSKEYQEVIDLAAAALYSKAEDMKKASNFLGAADVYKSIAGEFPTSRIADRGWFEAAVSYEEANNLELAAGTFETFAAQFPKSELREKAFVRSAENYKKAQKWELAAQIYAKAAGEIKKADFAIPSLSSASECYQKVDNYDMAGRMFETVVARYPDDARTPQALYNAGLILEKGKLYERAIKAYSTLAEKYPQSEYAEEASYSIGLSYEKMDKPEEAALAFSDFAKKYDNRSKQVDALIRAGDAYYKMGKTKDAETSYLSATTIYDKFKKKGDFDVEGIAKSYSRLGDLYYDEFMAIKADGRNERDVRNKLKEAAKALDKAGKEYLKAIETGVSDWVLSSNYKIGQSLVELANKEKNQELFGRTEQKIASRFKILSKLEKYYIKAQENFYWNINKAHEQNLKGEWVDKSIHAFMQMAFLKGRILEEAGEVLASAPIPRDLTPEEKEAYRQILEEKKLETMDAALPKYEDAIRAAKDLGIAESPWLDSAKARITVINPMSEWLAVEIEQWVPQEKTETAAAQASDAEGVSSDGMSAKRENVSGSGIIKLQPEEKEKKKERKGFFGRLFGGKKK